MFFNELYGLFGVFIFILFVAFFRSDVLFDGGACLVEARDVEGAINLLRHAQCVCFEVLELHFKEVPLGDEVFVSFVSVIEFFIDDEDVVHEFLFGELLKFEGLDGVGVEGACGLEDGVGVSHQIDELGVGEHFYQFLDASRVWRVFGEELRAAGVPEGDANHFVEGVFPCLQFFGSDAVEEHVFVAILLHVAWEEPEVIVGVGAHVGECELFLLGQVHGEFHVVGGTFVGHEPGHVLFEERLSDHHEVREDGLIGGAEAKVFVAGEDVVDEGCAGAPVTEDEDGVVFERFVGKQFFVFSVLQRREGGEESADGFRQTIFSFPRRIHGATGGDGFERAPVSTDQRVDGEFVEFNETHDV